MVRREQVTEEPMDLLITVVGMQLHDADYHSLFKIRPQF